MWYIIKTDYYKERDAIKDLLRLDSIEDIYFPNSRPKPEDIGWDKKKVSFRPVINGILFAYVKDVKLLLKDLNANGYFLQKEESPNEKRPQVAGNAHLFSLEGESEGLKSMLIHANISDEEIYRYKVCIEQSAVHTDDIKIVGKDYAELAANNDIVMITNGPFVGYTGVIKQVKSHGVKDRCFLFSLGGFCVQLSGIRRYEVIVVKETTKGTKAQLPNTWRYIDKLQGRLQATYFADNSAAVLRHILEIYNKEKDTEKCQALLLEEAKQKQTEAESRELALQAVWLLQAKDDDLAALKSLSRYFQSTDNSVAYGLADLIPDTPLRPFLTPTSGVELPKGKNYTLLPHDGFVELIFRVNLKQEFQGGRGRAGAGRQRTAAAGRPECPVAGAAGLSAHRDLPRGAGRGRGAAGTGGGHGRPGRQPEPVPGAGGAARSVPAHRGDAAHQRQKYLLAVLYFSLSSLFSSDMNVLMSLNCR